MRTERDVIGEVQIDDSIYYGINTLRAKNNFNISGIKSRDRDHIRAMAIVKKGAAYANYTSGKLQKELYESINKACDRLIAGEFDDQFVLDVFQAGAGTSFNMNTNEILANLVLESLNHKKGEYKYAHPNDVINMSQSTNDIYPTMMRVSMVELMYIEFTDAGMVVPDTLTIGYIDGDGDRARNHKSHDRCCQQRNRTCIWR
jgi:fumarase (EC 4.2.1.2)